MDVAHLDQLSELEQTYWWHVAKRQLVMDWLQEFAPAPGKLVEGGIGSAGNLLTFQNLGYEVSGLDIMPEAVEYGRKQGLQDVHVHDLEQPWPFKDASLDVVVLLDVIEHVSQPVQVLQHAHRLLKPSGKLILTVPAYQWLFSDWDDALGHYRRYTSRRLQQQTTAAGFQTCTLTHWNSFTLPAAIGLRGWQKLRPNRRPAEFPEVSPMVNQILLGCAAFERQWNRVMPVPCGLSVAGVFEKAPEAMHNPLHQSFVGEGN